MAQPSWGRSPPLPSATLLEILLLALDYRAHADFAGRIYINIHSTAFPGGEIRGQIDNNGQGVPFPSLGEWGILLLSLTLVATGAVFVVRRRAMA